MLTELHRICDYTGDGVEYKPEWEYVRNDIVLETVANPESAE